MSSGWNEEDWGSTPQDNDFSWDTPQAGQQEGQNWNMQSQDNTNWGNTEELDWGSTTPDEDSQNQDDYWASQEQYQNNNPVVPENNATRAPIKIGTKTVAVLLGGLFLIFALVLIVVGNISNKSNEPKEQQPQSNVHTQSNSNSNGLVQIPNNIALDYSGELFSTNATVRNKVKYKDNKQVVYCLELYVNFGSTSETWNYYCSYNAFCNVKLGDIVFVEYQVPQEGYVSITSVSK